MHSSPRRLPQIAPRGLRRTWTIVVFALAALVLAGFVPPRGPANADDAPTFRTFTSRDGSLIRARILEVRGTEVKIVREDGRMFTIPIDRFSDGDQEFLRGIKPPEDPAGLAFSLGADDSDELNPRVYPKSRREIKDEVKEIFKRDLALKGFEKDVLEAIATLNAYRYLSGVPPEVKPDKELNESARIAANGCAEIGRLDHGVNSEAGACNLSVGHSTLAGTVHGYMSDGGDNNRAARGHRKWCLTASIGKTGLAFADAGSYSGMFVFDRSGDRKWKPKDGFHAYPAPGFYPIEYFKTNGWSVYPEGGVPSKDDLKIRVFKVHKRPEEPVPSSRKPENATEVDVNYVSTQGSIVFEPDAKPEPGDIFWVSITGGGLRIAYFVEFFRL